MVLAAVAALAGAFAQSATGFGFALLVGPVLFSVRPPDEAVTTLLILGALMGLLVLFAERRPLHVLPREARTILLAAIPGLPLGVLALEGLSAPTLQLLLGVSVVSTGLIQLRQGRRRAAAGSAHGTAGSLSGSPGGVAAGLAAGALTPSITVNGPPVLLWLLAREAEPAQVRDTLATMFVALNVVALAIVVAVAGAGALDPGALAILAPLTLLGHRAGRSGVDRLAPERVRALLLALVLAAGVASAITGIVELT
jgi:uncharacterized membrane protein YfcA